MWLQSLDTINKQKNENNSRLPSILSNCISSYYFPYWKGTLGSDVLGMVCGLLILSNYRLFPENRRRAENECATDPHLQFDSKMLGSQVVTRNSLNVWWLYLNFDSPFQHTSERTFSITLLSNWFGFRLIWKLKVLEY